MSNTVESIFRNNNIYIYLLLFPILFLNACDSSSGDEAEVEDISGIRNFNVEELSRSCSAKSSLTRKTHSYITQTNSKVTIDAFEQTIDGSIIDNEVFLSWNVRNGTSDKIYDGVLTIKEQRIGGLFKKYLSGEINWIEKNNGVTICTGVDKWEEQLATRFCRGSNRIAPTLSTVTLPANQTPRVAFRIHTSAGLPVSSIYLTTPMNNTVFENNTASDGCTDFGLTMGNNMNVSNIFCNRARLGMYTLLIDKHEDINAYLTIETGDGNTTAGLNNKKLKFELPANVGCGQRFNIRVVK